MLMLKIQFIICKYINVACPTALAVSLFLINSLNFFLKKTSDFFKYFLKSLLTNLYLSWKAK